MHKRFFQSERLKFFCFLKVLSPHGQNGNPVSKPIVVHHASNERVEAFCNPHRFMDGRESACIGASVLLMALRRSLDGIWYLNSFSVARVNMLIFVCCVARELKVTESSESVLAGTKRPPFRLVVHAVTANGERMPEIRPAVSEQFVVSFRGFHGAAHRASMVFHTL